jgi:hypothetical protein
MERLPVEPAPYPATPLGSALNNHVVASLPTTPVAEIVTAAAQAPEEIGVFPRDAVPYATVRVSDSGESLLYEHCIVCVLEFAAQTSEPETPTRPLVSIIVVFFAASTLCEKWALPELASHIPWPATTMRVVSLNRIGESLNEQIRDFRGSLTFAEEPFNQHSPSEFYPREGAGYLTAKISSSTVAPGLYFRKLTIWDSAVGWEFGV